MTPDRHRFEIRCVGRAARASLGPGRQGSVLAVFHRSFYVAFDEGALACIGPPGMGAGPLNALADLPDGLDWQASGMTAGDAARTDRGTLRIGRTLEFAFDSAVVWSPNMPAPDWSRSALAAGLNALRREADRYDLTQGLASLVVDDFPDGGPLLERGRAGRTALRQWLADTDTLSGSPPAEVRELIGLGPGLTPSGDDLIGGALIALRAFGREAHRAALADWAPRIAARRTGRISLSHLISAGNGEGAAALHDAICNVAANDAPGIASALTALDRIGHSSGWDALAGAVAVMSFLVSDTD
jgi:hypothetical protein